MVDLVQSNITKSAIRKLADPIADVTAYEHTFQIISTPPGWGSNVSIINTLTSHGDYESALIASRKLPRLPGMTYMVYGSLSADFIQLNTFSKESETIQEAIVKMKKYLKEKKPEEKKNLHGVLIFAPDD